MTDKEIVLRLVIAALLGGLIGFEREKHGRVAGLRTHILVSLGSCLIMLTSIYVFEVFQDRVMVDPSRIAASVVTGVGFLGAGTIMRFRASVIGLTTAASIWAVSAIGLAIGCGFYTAGYITAAIMLITLVIFGKLERTYLKKYIYKVLMVETESETDQLSKIRSVLSSYNVDTKDYEFDKSNIGGHIIVKVTTSLNSLKDADAISSELMKIKGVNKISWE